MVSIFFDRKQCQMENSLILYFYTLSSTSVVKGKENHVKARFLAPTVEIRWQKLLEESLVDGKH